MSNLHQNEYFYKILRLLEYSHPHLPVMRGLEFKNVFGAVGGYLNGRIFISCGKFGVALRLPPDMRKRLLMEQGVKPLKYFPKGHIKKEYVILSKRILKNRHRLRTLIEQSLIF